MTRRPQADLDGPGLPAVGSYLWEWFVELNATRPAGFGASAITYGEMQSFFDLHRIDPEPWEVVVLRSLDAVALRSNESDAAPNAAKKPAAPPSKSRKR